MSKRYPGPPNYQEADKWCYDYGLINENRFSHRGPVSVHDGAPVIALGPAPTFGRLAERPFAQLLTQEYGVPTVNLGFAGPSPNTFKRFLDVINRHPCVIVSFFSGRSISMPFLKVDKNGTAVMLDDLRVQSKNTLKVLDRLNSIRLELGEPIPVGSYLSPKAAWEEILLNYDRDKVVEMVMETRQVYVDAMKDLLNSITSRKILLWFSRRPPDYEMKFDTIKGLFGKNPQLVDRTTVDALVPKADGFVECVTNRGMPFRISPPRAGGTYPWNIPAGYNDRYPSQEMHDDVAAVLGPYLQNFLKQHGIAY